MFKKVLVLCIAITAAAGLRASAQQGPNGTEKRPFYIIGHNPNTIDDATLAVQNGANMIEPDVIILPVHSHDPAFNSNPDGLVVYHDPYLETKWVPLTIEAYLDGVHNLAYWYPNLVAIMLDIKPEVAADPNAGQKILDAVRNHLNNGKDGVNLYVIYNVGTYDDAKILKPILSQLKENEGVQIDGENNALKATALLAGANFGNIGYGDGTLTIGPNLPRAIDYGSFLRAATGFPRVISDVFTIMREDTMNFFIDAGVDGIIPDWPDAFHPEFDPLITPGYIKTLAEIVKGRDDVRPATKDDNPFKPLNQAYGLELRTMDEDGAGTNADLTFTLNGCRGSSQITYNAGFVWPLYSTLRMEQGETDYATIPSLNLGKLTSLQIINHGGGFGGYPEWKLQDVAASSFKYLGQDYNHAFEYVGTLTNVTIPGNSSFNMPLKPNFTEPPPTIACPAPIAVDNAPGQCSAVVNFAPKAEGMCLDVTTSSLPPSGSTFDVGTTNVESTATSASIPGSNSCTFTVTVKDAEGPAITCPAPMTVDATGPQGVTTTFAPIASDNCSVSVTSAPASGSVFPIGTTTVNSTAQDPAGHQASCSFTVHVKGAAEQLTDLVTTVTNLPINQGNVNSLLNKLNEALASVSGQNTGSACNTLAAFINEVNAKRGTPISVSDADLLIAKATQIRAVLGC
jgi:glycerophosphoryl diester phosphodiesterase